jgi:hypothetical protein
MIEARRSRALEMVGIRMARSLPAPTLAESRARVAVETVAVVDASTRVGAFFWVLVKMAIPEVCQILQL